LFEVTDIKVHTIDLEKENPGRALELRQKGQPDDGIRHPGIFEEPSDVFEGPVDMAGRNRLALKPRNSEELLCCTTDDLEGCRQVTLIVCGRTRT